MADLMDKKAQCDTIFHKAMDCVAREAQAKDVMNSQQYTIQTKNNEIKIGAIANGFLKEQVQVANDQKINLEHQIKYLQTKNGVIGSALILTLVLKIFFNR